MASGTVAPDVRTAWQKCKQGDWEGARADLEAIVAARPDDLEARVCCGRVLAMRRMPEAEGHLRAALAIAPDDATAVLALAQFLSLERRMVEAAEKPSGVPARLTVSIWTGLDPRRISDRISIGREVA